MNIETICAENNLNLEEADRLRQYLHIPFECFGGRLLKDVMYYEIPGKIRVAQTNPKKATYRILFKNMPTHIAENEGRALYEVVTILRPHLQRNEQQRYKIKKGTYKRKSLTPADVNRVYNVARSHNPIKALEAWRNTEKEFDMALRDIGIRTLINKIIMAKNAAEDLSRVYKMELPEDFISNGEYRKITKQVLKRNIKEFRLKERLSSMTKIINERGSDAKKTIKNFAKTRLRRGGGGDR